jgi:hypothetical protein
MITPGLGTTGRLDVLLCTINECADYGQHRAARNQVHATSDARYDRLAVRRLGGHMARRMDQIPAALFGHGREGRP